MTFAIDLRTLKTGHLVRSARISPDVLCDAVHVGDHVSSLLPLGVFTSEFLLLIVVAFCRDGFSTFTSIFLSFSATSGTYSSEVRLYWPYQRQL